MSVASMFWFEVVVASKPDAVMTGPTPNCPLHPKTAAPVGSTVSVHRP